MSRNEEVGGVGFRNNGLSKTGTEALTKINFKSQGWQLVKAMATSMGAG
ncbi:hypothetical protein ACSYAD_22600 [Acaryochloris marina NIES-2412]